MANRFHALMVLTSSVRSTNSADVKYCFTRSHTSSGTRVVATKVTDSVQSRAARSVSVKKGVSRHTATADRRRSLSPALRASEVCTSMQYAQPLIWEARSRTNSTRDLSRPALSYSDLSRVLIVSLLMKLSPCGKVRISKLAEMYTIRTLQNSSVVKKITSIR